MDSYPTNANVDRVKQAAENRDDIDVGTQNSGGYEMKYSGDEAREWLQTVVEENKVRFDNPARIEAGHPYVLILPSEENERI